MKLTGQIGLRNGQWILLDTNSQEHQLNVSAKFEEFFTLAIPAQDKFASQFTVKLKDQQVVEAEVQVEEVLTGESEGGAMLFGKKPAEQGGPSFRANMVTIRRW